MDLQPQSVYQLRTLDGQVLLILGSSGCTSVLVDYGGTLILINHFQRAWFILQFF